MHRIRHYHFCIALLIQLQDRSGVRISAYIEYFQKKSAISLTFKVRLKNDMRLVNGELYILAFLDGAILLKYVHSLFIRYCMCIFTILSGENGDRARFRK